MIHKINIEGEEVSLKKDKTGIRIVYPLKNDNFKPYNECKDFKEFSNGINWFNFLTGGSWWILIRTILTILLILGVCYAYYHDTQECFKAIEENYYYKTTYGEIPNMTLNFSSLENIKRDKTYNITVKEVYET